MSKSNKDEKLSIFIDQPELQNIVLDFPNYAKTFSKIILNSTPQFTIGIFGEWGTGKTTLMKIIAGHLIKNKCNIIEFNAWRYEGETRSATFPLMLEILGNLMKFAPIADYIEKQPPRTKEAIKGKITRVLNGLSGSIGVNIGAVNAQLDVDPSKMKSETKNMSIENMWKFYDEHKPILQEGVDLIQLLLSIAPSHNDNSELKLVIFIDDLDRCTPEKAAEIFESIKVFFDLKGIVFVLGLSLSIVEAAIDVKYKDFQKTFSGSDYIKKIIQVPFTLPTWKKEDIEKYILTLVNSYENLEYKKFFQEHKGIISEGVATNPREVKRLLNNFILSNTIYQNQPEIKKEVLLMIQVVSMRWKWFYDAIMAESGILSNVKNVIFPPITVNPINESDQDKKEENTEIFNQIIQKIENELEFKQFLIKYGKILFDLTNQDLVTYRRATSIEQTFDELDKENSSWWEEIKHQEELEKKIAVERKREEKRKRDEEIRLEEERRLEEKRKRDEEIRLEEERRLEEKRKRDEEIRKEKSGRLRAIRLQNEKREEELHDELVTYEKINKQFADEENRNQERRIQIINEMPDEDKEHVKVLLKSRKDKTLPKRGRFRDR